MADAKQTIKTTLLTLAQLIDFDLISNNYLNTANGVVDFYQEVTASVNAVNHVLRLSGSVNRNSSVTTVKFNDVIFCYNYLEFTEDRVELSVTEILELTNKINLS